MTDIHLNPNYTDVCGFPLCLDLGNYGTDTPEALLNATLDDMQLMYNNVAVNGSTLLDVILMSGDFVVHGLASTNLSDPLPATWATQKSII